MLLSKTKIDRTVVRNAAYRSGEFNLRERHNERKNESYHNGDIDITRADMNIHFRKNFTPDGSPETYEQTFNRLIDEGKIVKRGLKPDAKIFAEMIFDVNTAYFDIEGERLGVGGYEYAKSFFEEAYKCALKEIGSEDYVLSAVLHADERNKALSGELGRDVYHYHLHVMYVPVVEKEILWSKRTKDKSLIGKVKEVIPQISHSKKWPMRVPVERDGAIIQVNSYSLLQDRFYEHMQQAGFEGFERGERGSNREHLSDLDYKIQQDKKRLAEKEKELKAKELELAEKEGRLKLAEMELDEVQAEIESNQTKNNRLKTKQAQLSADVAGIKELRKLNIRFDEINIPDKPAFSSSVKMPYADVVKLKNMADAYIANEAEIKDVRKRRGAVKTREDNATTREIKVTNREQAVKADEKTLKNAKDVKADRDKLQRLFDTQVSEIDVLKTTNNKLGTNLNSAYTIMSDIVEAVQIFKYPVEDMEEFDEYRIDNISPKQSALIDALAEYGAKSAENINGNKYSNRMRTSAGLYKDIVEEMKIISPELFPKPQAQVQAQEPQKPVRRRDYNVLGG